MPGDAFNDLVLRGLAALETNDTLTGLMLFEEAAMWYMTPIVCSCLGFCLACERQDYRRAVRLCLQARNEEPNNALHYLNLGRVLQLAGRKRLAIRILHHGLRMGEGRALIDEMKALGRRRPPPFLRLPRSHPLNKHVGRFLYRIGWR